MEPLRCPQCKGTEIYLQRHDCDWDDGNDVSPVNDASYYKDGPDENMDADIEIFLCGECYSQWV